MSYEFYLENILIIRIMGGLCTDHTRFGNYEKLEHEIKRVFSLLKGKRWLFCTTHFVQDHCSIDELVFAYDLVRKLANG